MNKYITRSGIEITEGMLRLSEKAGKSEEEIAKEYGITRMGLYKIRKKMDWPDSGRSDKGKRRKALIELEKSFFQSKKKLIKKHKKNTKLAVSGEFYHNKEGVEL